MFSYWDISRVVDLDFSLIYMDGKLRNRPTMFMNSVRLKSAVFKFKVWPQKTSQNLSCNPAQTLLRILPISGVLEGKNDMQFGG
jgi:hypothetical protein